MPNEWDKTPWMIGGGARHSANVGRLLAYAAFDGDEGIIGSADLAVLQAATPNGTVRVLPGACSILNRSLNANYEAYAARLPILDTVAISPTGAGSGRSDLIVAVVTDPFPNGSPWPDPPQETIDDGTAEFVKTMVIPNVPANTTNVKSLGLNYSALALARVDIPANTGTITQAMVKDLRRMSAVRSKTDGKAQHVSGGTGMAGSYAIWPHEASTTVDVPEWATHATLKANVLSVAVDAGFLDAHLLLQFGTGTGFTVNGPETYINYTVPDADVVAFTVGSNVVAIPPILRGTETNLTLLAYKGVGGAAVTSVIGMTSFDFEVRFQQSPEYLL